jgi:SAM-dependent methyltransferase
MENYISKTVRAYDDVNTYEKSTRSLRPKLEIDDFLTMLQDGARILDAGCAFGRDVEYIKSQGFDIYGIDLSPVLIRRAKELAPAGKFDVKDIRDTGFEDGQFEGIWCNATLLHLKDKDMKRALAEFSRILKPDGILAASLKKGSGTQQFVENFSSNSERFFNFQTHESFLRHLTACGFEEVAWHYVNERERFGEDGRDIDWLYSFSKKHPFT